MLGTVLRSIAFEAPSFAQLSDRLPEGGYGALAHTTQYILHWHSGAHRMAAWSPGTGRTLIGEEKRHTGQRPIEPRIDLDLPIIQSVSTLS